MLIRAYLPKLLTALFGGLFIALGIFSFGHAAVFDRVFLAVLIFTAIVCRHDINVVSVITLLLAQALLSELVWLLLSHYSLKPMIILLAIISVYYFRHDKIVRLIGPILLLVSVTEIYWFLTDYPSPKTCWYLWLIISGLLMRHLLFIRIVIIERFFPKKATSIHLDWALYKLSAVYILVQLAITCEYIIRHLANYPELLVVYEIYPYLIQGLSTLAIWFVFYESYKLLLPKLLKA